MSNENLDPNILKTPERSWSPEDEFFTPAARSNSATSLTRESETPKRRTFHGMTAKEKVEQDIEGITQAVDQLKENIDNDMRNMLQTEWKSPLKKASVLQDLPQFSDERQSAPTVKERVNILENTLTARRSLPSPVPPSTMKPTSSTSAEAVKTPTPPLPKLLGQQLQAEINYSEVTEKHNESLGRVELNTTYGSLNAMLEDINIGDYTLPDFELAPQLRTAFASTSGARSSRSAESLKSRPSLPTKLSDEHTRKKLHDQYLARVDEWLQMELKQYNFVMLMKMPKERRPFGYDAIAKQSAAMKKVKAGKLLASPMATNELSQTLNAKTRKLQARMKYVGAQILVQATMMKEHKSRKSADRSLHTIDEAQEHGHRASTSPARKDATTSPTHFEENVTSPKVETSFILEDNRSGFNEGDVTSENVSLVTAVEASLSTEERPEQKVQAKEDQKDATPEVNEAVEDELSHSRASLEFTAISSVSRESLLDLTKDQDISDAHLSIPADANRSVPAESIESLAEAPKLNVADLSMDPFDRPLPETDSNDSVMSQEELKEDEVVEIEKEALQPAVGDDEEPVHEEISWVPSPDASFSENKVMSPEPAEDAPVSASNKYALDLSALDDHLMADESLSDFSFSKMRLAAGGVKEQEKGPIEVPSKRDSIGSLDRSIDKSLDRSGLELETSSPRRNSLERFNTTFPSPRRADSPVQDAPVDATATVISEAPPVMVEDPANEQLELNNSMNMSLNDTEDYNWLDKSIGTIAPGVKKDREKAEKLAVWEKLQENDVFWKLVVKECCAHVWEQKEMNGGVALDDDLTKTISDRFHCADLSNDFLEIVEKRKMVEDERKASLRDVLKIAKDLWPLGGEDTAKKNPLLPRTSKYTQKYPPKLTLAEFEDICLRKLFDDRGPSLVETTSRGFSWENDKTRLIAHEMICEEQPMYLKKEVEEYQQKLESELANGAAEFFSNDAMLEMKINSARESLASARGSLDGRRSSIAPE